MSEHGIDDEQYWREIEESIGFGPGELEEYCGYFERGERPPGDEIIGRLVGRTTPEDFTTAVLSVQMLERDIEKFDAKAKANGQSRTERMRELIWADIAD